MMGKENFTAARVDAYTCPPEKGQAFYWDAKVPGFGLRVTKNGVRAYIFESRVNGQTRRQTIGHPASWTLGAARAEASKRKTETDRGLDPRKLKAEAAAAHKAELALNAARTVTVSEAWSVYLEEGKKRWGPRHYKDHLAKAQPGGRISARGTRGRGVTIPGPLFEFMGMKLSELSASIVEEWAEREAKIRDKSASLGRRHLQAFLNWCAQQPEFASSISGNPAMTRRTQLSLRSAIVKKKVLQRQQLAAWFSAVTKLPNPVIGAYLQTLLLTGGRPSEVRNIQWKDLDFTWMTLTIRDKVEGTRIIPLTPYVHHLLCALPRRSDWVFSATHTPAGGVAKPISSPNAIHAKACSIANIDGVVLHGLRGSFKTLSEWIESPVGVVAQIMGHKPSATAEKHYTVRETDLLRRHHERIEAWILEQAGVGYFLTSAAQTTEATS
jgi:integrase